MTIEQTTKTVVETAKSMPDVQDKLVSMLDALQQGAVKVGETVVQYSPDVANAALWVVRIDGIQCIVTGAFYATIGALGVKYTIKAWRWATKDASDQPVFLVPLVLGVVTGIAVVAASNIVLNVWNWIAVFEPKLWLAKQIIAAALK